MLKQSPGNLPVGSTPLPPPTSGSGVQPSQLSQSHSSSHVYDDPAHNQVTTFSPNLPSWLEALKGHNVAVQTTIDLTHAKISYLQSSTDANRVGIAQGVSSIVTGELDLQRRAARDVLRDPDALPEHREAAVAVYTALLNPDRPGVVHTDEFVRRLRLLLPDISNTVAAEIDNPNHPTNIVDFVESVEFAELFNDAALAGVASSSGAAGLSGAAGPSRASGPPSDTNPPGSAGPSRTASDSGVTESDAS
jgi:hypothetical protein